MVKTIGSSMWQPWPRRRTDVAGGADHGDLEVDQFGRVRRQLL